MTGSINEHAPALAAEWRRLGRAATFVALLTAPAFFLVLYDSNRLGLVASLIITIAAVIIFRGLVEVIVRKLIPSPSLYGADQGLMEQDLVARRRYWFWRTKFRRLPMWILAIVLAAGAVPAAVRVRRRQRAVLPPVRRAAPDLPAGHPAPAGAGVRPAAAAAVHQRLHPVRAVPVHGRRAGSAATSPATPAGA